MFYILFYTKSLKANVYFICIACLNSDAEFSSKIPDWFLDLITFPFEKNRFTHPNYCNLT